MFGGFVPVITSITGAESSKPPLRLSSISVNVSNLLWKEMSTELPLPGWNGPFQVSTPKHGVILASRWHYGLQVLLAFLFFILGLDRLSHQNGR